MVNEIEGRLNDFEGGVTEKDETIKSFAFFIGECAKNAVNNALVEHDKEIISLIDDIIANERKQSYEIALTELKEKILENGK